MRKGRPAGLSRPQAKPDRIAVALEREIRSGILSYGAKLESESQLVCRFAVSRSTVRKGLERLAERGLITTRVGIGSFVTFDSQIIDNSLGWTRALGNRELSVETRQHQLSLIDDPELAQRIGCATTRFFAIDRTRALAETGRVVSIERSRVPWRPELADLAETGLVDGSLSATLRQAGLAAAGGEEWVEIEHLSPADAETVGVAAGTPFLRARRLERDAGGDVIEHVVSLLDPKHFSIHMTY